MTKTYSLLIPTDLEESERKTFVLQEETAEDLGVDTIADRIAGPGITSRQVLAILKNPSMSRRLIEYRHDVLDEIVMDQALLDGFEELIPRIRELFYFTKVKSQTESPILQAIWRLGELEIYVECLDTLAALLQTGADERASEGLAGLTKWLETIRRDPTFARLKAEIPGLRSELKERRSVTIGVNLDSQLRPTEATLVSVNETPYTSRTLFGRLFGTSTDRREFESIAPIHEAGILGDAAPGEGAGLPLNPLFNDIDVLLRSLIHPIVESLNTYFYVNVQFLRALASELSFYTGAAKLFRECKARGLPICKPTIDDTRANKTIAEEFYNIHLAMRSASNDVEPTKVVPNELRLDDSGRIGILTGPNQGGKTTFTQGVGLLHLLAQVGLLVPASNATVSPADSIETHFPIGEKGELKTGRLAEETERLAAMFHRITSRSLILLNESLSSTSPKESLILAEEIVKALRYLGVRCVFATHLHDLAEEAAAINDEVSGSALLFSLVAGIDETASTNDVHRRTYEITRGEPSGTSYASDIARKSGIGYSDLINLLDIRSRNDE